jgi:urease accessory protein
MLMAASAGIMENDRYNASFTLKQGSYAAITSQAFEKIHKMEGGEAIRRTAIALESDTFLYYSPLPAIAFEKSKFLSETVVHLADDTSRLVFSDIFINGRIARGELFKYELYGSDVKIYKGGRLIYRDNSRFEPGKSELANCCFFDGNTHYGSMVLINCGIAKQRLDKIKDGIRGIDLEKGVDLGMSMTHAKDLVVKALARNTQDIQRCFDAILDVCGIERRNSS